MFRKEGGHGVVKPDPSQDIGQMLIDFNKQLLDAKPPFPVDADKLRRYHNNELNDADTEVVTELIATYRVWFNESNRVLAEIVRGQDSNAAQVDVRPNVRRLWAIGSVLALAATLLFALIDWPRSALRDGEYLVRLEGDSLTGLESYPKQWQRLAERSLSKGVDDPVVVDGLRKRSTTRSDSPWSEIIERPYMSVVMSDEPVLSWRPVREATKYEVVVLDDEGEIVGGPILAQATSVRSPKLLRGEYYNWRVIATVDGSEFMAPRNGESPAMFFVLEAADVERIKANTARLEGSHLLLSTMLMSEGLMHDAAGEIESLHQQNSHTEIVERLQSALYDLWGNSKMAPQ